jgi:hypothetical protein
MVKARVLVVFLLLAVTLQAATVASEMVGRWHFLPEKSKGGQHFPPETTLVVKQAGARMYFEYWANNRLFQRDDYRTDGKLEKLYKNKNEEVYLDGRLSKDKLRLTTHHVMENEVGSQSFDDTETWVLSKDGKMLTFESADNKNMYFEREQAKPAAATPPPTTPTPAAKK